MIIEWVSKNSFLKEVLKYSPLFFQSDKLFSLLQKKIENKNTKEKGRSASRNIAFLTIFVQLIFKWKYNVWTFFYIFL
jgi:hypothetical protein